MGASVSSSTEKLLSTASNIITVIGFFIAMFEWLGILNLPSYTPPSKNVAIFIILMFGITFSYAIASHLRARVEADKPSIFLSFILTPIFAFMAVNIEKYLGANFSSSEFNEYESNAIAIFGVAYVVSIFFFYGLRYVYPAGFTLGEWFKGSFRPRTYVGFGAALLNIMLLGYCLQTFSGLAPAPR